MDTSAFEQVQGGLRRLTIEQLRRVAEEADALLKQRQADAIIEARRSDGRFCPKCGSPEVGRWGAPKGLQRWRCKDCGRTFNDASGTPLARMRHRDRLFAAVGDMLSDTPRSCRKLADALGINKMTALTWRHRVLDTLKDFGDASLAGTVEADETFFRESRKGSREWVNHAKGIAPPPPRPRWVDYLRKKIPLPRGLSRWQRPVLVLRDRHGQTRAQHLPELRYEHFETALDAALAPDAMLFSDSAAVYRRYSVNRGRFLEQINARRGILVRNGVIHIQNANSFHARLKEFMKPFRGPASKNLSAYVGWMTFRDRHQNDNSAQSALFIRVLSA